MPAKKNPVKNRKLIKLNKVCDSNTKPKLKIAPKIALTKNTLEGEKRSAIVNRAKTKVPEINPNCTAAVKLPNALSCKLKVVTKFCIMPFPANHKEVQQN